ncbi:ExbD/TolR family protein [Rubritalea spongiae]|uniref:ExbD/TolR family protein n=1 Tax=Rubritalea spongiae TaxID=430797 RepID=A0ABW5E4V2_9BACT
MSRRKHSTLTEEDEPELDISSLIDVCFLLLIYFMVTATIQPRESDIGLQLPSFGGAISKADASALIEIQSDGSILYGGHERLDLAAVGPERELPQLQQRLETYKMGIQAGGGTPMVQLAVGGETSQQSVIDVMNCLVGLQLSNVTFTDLLN